MAAMFNVGLLSKSFFRRSDIKLSNQHRMLKFVIAVANSLLRLFAIIVKYGRKRGIVVGLESGRGRGLRSARKGKQNAVLNLSTFW
jgi:hypothetical protein